jgi:hypothetical protein
VPDGQVTVTPAMSLWDQPVHFVVSGPGQHAGRERRLPGVNPMGLIDALLPPPPRLVFYSWSLQRPEQFQIQVTENGASCRRPRAEIFESFT